MSHLVKTQSLQSIFWSQPYRLTKEVLLILCGVLTLAISAQISIPLVPVPLTFQSATVLLIGLAFGARLGAYTIAGYLAAGACGLPVFAQMYSGIPVFFGPTGGYLLGFLPAAWLAGYLAQQGWASSITRSFLAACLGAVVIFALGYMQLANFIGWDKSFQFGVKPFLVTELIKLLAVAIFVPKLWKR